MPDVIYESDPALGRKIEVREYDHDDDTKKGAIHYYDEHGAHIKGDEFLEYMRPDALEERKQYIQENAAEARDWRRRNREGSLIDDEGRALDENSNRLYPDRSIHKQRNKLQKTGDAVVDAARESNKVLRRISKEAKDNAVMQVIKGDIEEARRILAAEGIDLDEVVNGTWKPDKADGKPNDGNTKVDGDEANTVISTPKDDKEKGGGKKDPENTPNPSANKFAEKHPQIVINIINDVRGRMDKAAADQDLIDLRDKSVREKVEEQFRRRAVDDYINSLPDDQKEQARKQRKEILEASKMKPEDLEAMKGPLQEHFFDLNEGPDRIPAKLRIRGGQVHINRNIDKDGNVVGGEDGWIEYDGPINGYISRSGKPQEGAPNLDLAALEALNERLAKIHEELLKDDLTPERRAELMKELGEAISGQKELSSKVEVKTDETPMTPEEAVANSKEHSRNLFKRISDAYKKAKGELINKHAERVTGGPGEDGDEGGENSGAVVVDEKTDEKSKANEKDKRNRKRYAKRAVGVVAVAAVAYFLGTRHGMHVHEFCQGHKSGIGPDHIPNHNAHVDFFNAAEGHRRTVLDLPPSLRLAHDSGGHQIIVDSHNSTVLSHQELPHGIADHQNKLSKAARHALENKGYSIKQIGVEQPDGSYSYASQVVG